MDSLVFTDAGSLGKVAIFKKTSRQRDTYPSNDKHLMTMENYFTKSTSQPPFNLTLKANLVLGDDENSILFFHMKLVRSKWLDIGNFSIFADP